MARLLDPVDFGLVAIAGVALRFYSYFSQMGVMPALIQKSSLDDGDIRAALALSMGISSLFFLLAISTAGIVERAFDMASLALIMQVLAINFIVSGFAAVSMGLIRRNNAFKALAMIEIVSYVFGYGVIGLGAAYSGGGVWALVAAMLSQSLLSAIIGYFVVRHPLGFKHTKAQRVHFIGYGGRYSIIGFVEFLTSNIDSLIVGKLMGPAAAGYYNRSLLLANLPVQQPTRVLREALFPIMSSMSDRQDRQSISVQLGALLVGCYAFAVGAGISVAAPDIVIILLGRKWVDSIPVLKLLAWSVGPIYVSNIIGVTLDSMGKLSEKLRIQVIVLGLLMVLLLVLAPSGDVTHVAMAVVIACWAQLIIMSWTVVRVLGIPVANVVQIASGIIVVAVCAGAMVLAAWHLVSQGFPAPVRLCAEILSGVLGFAVGIFFLRFIVSQHPGVLFLAGRMPIVTKLLSK